MKKHVIGTVKSAKMTKTAIVDVVHFKVHPKYLKRIKVNKSYSAHNEIGAKEGDSVRLEETRPISKNKHWIITKVL
jgi:small subunit ribosomal protein S17